MRTDSFTQFGMTDPRLPAAEITGSLKTPARTEVLLEKQNSLQHELAELLARDSCLLKPTAPNKFESLEAGKKADAYNELFIHVELAAKRDARGRLKFSEIESIEIRGCKSAQTAMAHMIDRTSRVRKYETNVSPDATVRTSPSSFTLVAKCDCPRIAELIEEHMSLKKSSILAPLFTTLA